MTHLEIIKNRLIDKIMVTKNEKLLSSLEGIITLVEDDELVKFSPEQIEMLLLAEDDITYGRVMSQEDLDKQDEGWLK